MKIVCDREKLLSAFQTAALFAPGRSPKEILTNIKLDVDKDGATFSATDMEVGVRIKIEGLDVDAPGSAILPLVQFGAILRESSDQKLRIDSTAKGTIVRGLPRELQIVSELLGLHADCPGQLQGRRAASGEPAQDDKLLSVE